jgi:uncharacterized protein (TIGR03437 family)
MKRVIVYLFGLAAIIFPSYGQSNGYAIATAAGGATPYYYSGLGDGGPATSAALGIPTNDVTVDGNGNFYIVAGNLIRKVTPDGKIATVAGGGSSVGEYVQATQAALSPLAIVADGAGDLFIADTAYGNSRIRMVDTMGIITTIAGGAPCCALGDGGPATNGYIGVPYGLARDSSGSLYIAQADIQNNVIRKISGGFITTIAGGGKATGDGGLATTIALAHPVGVAVDSSGNVYIAEANANKIREVTSSGIITTIAGNGSTANSGDGGPAVQAGVDSPYHVAVDAAGDLFITQINDARVRMVSPTGTITTIAGNGSNGSSGDGGPGPNAKVDRPAGIALGNCTQIYVTENSDTIPTVRILNPTPAIFSGGIVPSGSSASMIESGSWVSIYGTNLAGCTASWNGNFPTSLGGTSVSLDSKPGYLWFVSPGQINVQPPDDSMTGPINVVVTTAGGTTSSTVTLAQYAPAFSLFSSKYPAAIVSNAAGYDNIGPTGAFSFPTRPVKAGEIVTLFGGGFGPTNPPVAAGQLFSGAAPCAMTPQVTIGGMQATVVFAGLVEAGLYQLNVIVPNAGSGDQPLQASVGGATTQGNLFITLQ